MKKILMLLGIIVLFVSCQNKGKEFKTHYTEGLKFLDASNYQKALVEFNECIKLKPEHPESYYYRGATKSNLKDTKGALEDYSKAIELNPKYADAYYNRGLLYDFLAKKEEKCRDFHKAYDLGKTNIEIRLKECTEFE